MDKEPAKNLVKETLQSPFDKKRFVLLLKNMLNRFDESKAFRAKGYVKEKFKTTMPIIRTYERVGTYTDSEDRKTDLLIVYLQKENSIERARTSLRNFVADYLKQRDMKDAALVAFVAPNGTDWRFSFVKMEYKFNKISEDFTPARRYSFLVGENENSHTAQSRLLPLLQDDDHAPKLADLEDAFSVEKVTKEFFEQYRDLFVRIKESLDTIVERDTRIKADFKAKNIKTGDFAKKLLGQIVFLYFLQKKGWFGVQRGKDWGSGSKRFLRELFEKNHGDYNNFFNDILEPLFYEALRLERPKDYYDQFKCRIPFLNGGLFDPINDYDWQDTDIEIPDTLFSNARTTKEGDIGDGVLDVFDRYNFTVKEDEPMEKEVAVDPEMLGKVFENLLEVKDRKSKGTYYTPREIVHYMCQESLINYLHSECNHGMAGYEKLGDPQMAIFGNEANKGQLDLTIKHRPRHPIKKEDIETLIRHGESMVEHDSRVAKKGSETQHYSFKLPDNIRNHAKFMDEKLASIRVCDPAVGSGAFVVGMMNEIIRTRNALTPHIGQEGERMPYHFKRHAIQSCLYGVDIDPGAVEIAKLRLWLSLIVDEEDRETIQPLPNLDYKIVRGNALLSVAKNLFNEKPFRQLEKLKPLYFNETSISKKQKYKKQIDELISEITDSHKDFDFEVYFSEVFHEKKGFDVVIANPPYDVLEKVTKRIEQKKFLKRIRHTNAGYNYSYGGKLNLYRFFTERGFRIVKNYGIQTFIIPSGILADKNTASLRRMFATKGAMKFFIEIPEKTKIFENVTQAVSIFSIQKTAKQDSFLLAVNIQSKKLPPPNSLDISWDEIEKISGPDLSIPLISKPLEYEVLRRLHSRSIFLGEIAKVAQGDVNLTVHNKYILDRPTGYFLVRGEHISRFRVDLSSTRKERRWLDFERIKKEINHRKVSIISTDCSRERIVCQNVANMALGFRIIPTLIPAKVFVGHSAEFIYPLDNEWDIRAMLGIISSSLLNWHFKKTSTNNHVNIYELENLPFPKLSSVEQKPLAKFVDKILAITKDNDYLPNPAKQAKVHEYEKQIDQLVYKLYNLTPSEIAVIEKNG